MDIHLFNTLGREKQVFKPITPGKAGMYCCGLTVYNYAHIGNLRAYIFEDLLKRVLLYNGYEVKHVMNITDVGHLQSDADEGEDKMELGSKREGKTAWELSEYYTKEFQADLKALNIFLPDVWCKATDHIKEQIELVQCLEKKGFTYITGDGVYFDTSKLPDYGKLAGLDIEGLKAGARIEMNEEKKNKTDFSLWKFSPKGKKRQMEWDSPWGVGFPGWHIECSAMSMKYLGETFDIHCGGVDHVSIHHTNEIAQSEACTGHKFVNYWMHNEFLIIEAEKMSKSSGDFIRLKSLIDKGYDPLDFRYFCLGAVYRKHLQFTWENLDAARNAYQRLKNRVIEFKASGEHSPERSRRADDNTELINDYKQRFLEAVNDDLNIPAGLAVMWDVVRNDLLSLKARLELLYDFDNVFGLGLKDVKEKSGDVIPEEVKMLVEQRAEDKKNKDFRSADKLRNELRETKIKITDTIHGTEIKDSRQYVDFLYTYAEAEERLKDFKKLLNEKGINIHKGSLLEKICNNIGDTYKRYLNSSFDNEEDDIRPLFSEMLGLNDLIFKILRVKNNPEFDKLVPHLKLLNKGSVPQNMFSSVLDQNSNKIFEFLIASICLTFSKKLRIDTMKDSVKGRKPDLILEYEDQRWAIECKTLHTKVVKTIWDRITDDAIPQLESQSECRGLIIVNLKNIIDHDDMWPIINKKDALNSSDYIYRSYTNVEIPTKKLLSVGDTIRSQLIEEYDGERLVKQFENRNIIPGILLFLQTATSMISTRGPVPVSLGIFHLINLSRSRNDFKKTDLLFLNKLNAAMHNV